MKATLALRAAVAVQSMTFTTGQRARAAQESVRSDQGLTTLEIVLWAVGLLAAASAAIAAITLAINNRVNGIK
jgi:hypothetical protein